MGKKGNAGNKCKEMPVKTTLALQMKPKHTKVKRTKGDKPKWTVKENENNTEQKSKLKSVSHPVDSSEDSESDDYISQFNMLSRQTQKTDVSTKEKDKEESSEDSDEESSADDLEVKSDSESEEDGDHGDSEEESLNEEEDAMEPPGKSKDSESDSGNSTEESEDEEKGSAGDEFAQLRKELEDMPFEEVQKLQERVGMKIYGQVFGNIAEEKIKHGKKVFKRANKNRPMEMSSKKSVKVFREVVQTKKKAVRDPRFDDLSGDFDEHLFKNSYRFLTGIKLSEKQKLLKRLKKEKDEDKRKELDYLIQRMTNQERAEKEKEARKDRERMVRKREREMVMEGKKPFYMKKSEQRKLELAEKFRELEKSGKVDTYLGKKRKKNASKDRKRLPFQK